MTTAYQHTGKETYLKDFEKNLSGGKTLFAEMQQGAISQFNDLGFPTTKHEEWKYTNVAPILKNDFSNLIKADFTLTKKDILPFLIAGKDATVLVFENGIFNQELSTIENQGEGIVIGSLRAHQNNPVLKEHIGKYASGIKETFISLNTAFLNDGAFIHIPEKIVASRPIHLLYVNDMRSLPAVIYPRNLIIAEKSSAVKIIESYHTVDSVNHGFTNNVTEIVVKDGAAVEFNKIQSENSLSYHISHTEALVGRDSIFNTSTITLGGAIVRNNLHVVMNGLNGTAHLNGLFLTNGHDLVDNHTLVDHVSPNCYSNELYKGILNEQSHGVFNGKVFVRKDAQKTNAYQSNKNILLSDDASMNTKPQLEIFADDVKCSHGATTGQLDEEALFYLRSRGIGEKQAKDFLNVAFAAEVVNKISVETFREHLMHLVEEKFQKGS